MPKLIRTEEDLRLSLSGSTDFKEALARAKAIPGRRYDPDTKCWVYPVDPSIAERILFSVPQIIAEAPLIAWVRAERSKQSADLATTLPEDASLRIPWADELRSYQRSYVAFAVANPHNLLGDDMGIGKSAQALSTVAEYVIQERAKDGEPKLIVCPNSVKGVWQREIRKWLGKDYPYQVIDHYKPAKRVEQLNAIVKAGGYAIINWEKLRTSLLSELVEVEWLAVIADEAHRAKNRKAQQTQGLWKLEAPIQLALTGTPLANAPAELWSVLRWLYKEQYHERGRGYNGVAMAYWAFFDEYSEAYEGFKGKVVTGVKNPDALRFELKDRLVRRTKGQVLDLPEKVRVITPVELGTPQRKLYREAETKLWIEIEDDLTSDDPAKRRAAQSFVEGILEGRNIYEIPNAGSRTVRLRQINCNVACLGGEDLSAKMDAAQEIIVDNQPKQFGVFCEFKAGCDVFVERLQKSGVIARAYHGDVKPEDRTKLEEDFQEGKIDVLVGTIKAMGLGLTLTAADTAIFIDRSWVPADNEQAEDRFYRLGQKNNVTIIILEAQDTVDDKNLKPTNRLKSLIVSAVTAQDEVKEITQPMGAIS